MSEIMFPKTVQYWNTWAGQTVKFVKKYVEENKELDVPFLRSSYILLSYAFELMLKSRLVVITSMKENQVKKYLHHIDKIADELKSLNELERVGIQCIVKNKSEHIYIIKTVEGEEFKIHDFTEIRYQPQSSVVSDGEHHIIKKTTDFLLRVVDNVEKLKIK